MVELELRVNPVMISPYIHLKVYKDEIENTIKEFLNMKFIWTSFSPFAYLVVLVKKKDGIMRMCINYRLLKNKTIKNRYPIIRVDNLFDELYWGQIISKNILEI